MTPEEIVRESANGIEIYPAFFSTYIEQDEEEVFNITVKNNKSSDLNVTYKFGAFAQNPQNLSNYLTSLNKYQSWFSAEPTIISAGSEKEIPIILNIPSNQVLNSATYYPTIILQLNSSEEISGSTASINIEQAIPLYLNVQANEQALLQIQQFETERFNFDTEIKLYSKFQNIGNTNLKVDSYIDFYQKGLLGRSNKRLEPVSIEDSSTYLFPDSEMEKKTKLELTIPGKYQAILNVEENGYLLDSKEINFWIIPNWWWIAVLIALTLLTSLILLITRLIKRIHKGKWVKPIIRRS